MIIKAAICVPGQKEVLAEIPFVPDVEEHIWLNDKELVVLNRKLSVFTSRSGVRCTVMLRCTEAV